MRSHQISAYTHIRKASQALEQLRKKKAVRVAYVKFSNEQLTSQFSQLLAYQKSILSNSRGQLEKGRYVGEWDPPEPDPVAKQKVKKKYDGLINYHQGLEKEFKKLSEQSPEKTVDFLNKVKNEVLQDAKDNENYTGDSHYIRKVDTHVKKMQKSLEGISSAKSNATKQRIQDRKKILETMVDDPDGGDKIQLRTLMRKDPEKGKLEYKRIVKNQGE